MLHLELAAAGEHSPSTCSGLDEQGVQEVLDFLNAECRALPGVVKTGLGKKAAS